MMYGWLNVTDVLGKLGSDFFTVPEQNPGGVSESTRTQRHEVDGDEGPVVATGDLMNPDIYQIDLICKARVVPVWQGILQEQEACKASLFLLGTTLDDANKGDYLEWARDFSTDAEEIGSTVGRHRLIDDKLVSKELARLLAVGKHMKNGLEEICGTLGPNVEARNEQLAAARELYFSLQGVTRPDPPQKRAGCSAAQARTLARAALSRPLVGKPPPPPFSSCPSVVTWFL